MTRIRTSLGGLDVNVEGHGPVAVLWHSLYVDDRSWDRLAPELAEARTLVRITGPGHGDSEGWTRPFDLDACRAAALQVLLELEIGGPVDWVGSAWGGHVGIVLAAANPRMVRSLIAFSSPVQALSPAEARAPRLLASLFRLLGPIRPALDGVTNALLSAETRAGDPEAVDYVQACLRGADRAGLVNAIRSISLRRPDLRPALASVAAPTVFVTTPDNPLWTPAQARDAVALMPDAEVAIVEHAGHLAPFEAPEASAALVRALWARTAP